MAKEFARRVSKNKRKTLDLSKLIEHDRFKDLEQGYLANTPVQIIKLKDIHVKKQVRTKFNDHSLKELADNIRLNGLIQPLVLHKENGAYTLLCGERRFRAMSLIPLEEAPCHVLEDKSLEELMSIQFSENSSRENLHYIDKANGINDYQNATGASERKIQKALGISKSEVHRSLIIGRLPEKIKEAAKEFNIEKYVLLEWDALERASLKKKVLQLICDGLVTTRTQLKRVIKAEPGLLVEAAQKKTAPRAKRNLSAAVLLKTMQEKSKNLDPEMQKALQSLLKESKETIDL